MFTCTHGQATPCDKCRIELQDNEIRTLKGNLKKSEEANRAERSVWSALMTLAGWSGGTYSIDDLKSRMTEQRADANRAAEADRQLLDLVSLENSTLEWDKSGVKARLKPPVFFLHMLAQSAMDFLGPEMEAPNYREMHFEFTDPKKKGGPPIVVTVKRPNGKSQGEVVSEFRKKIDVLRAALEAARWPMGSTMERNDAIDKALGEVPKNEGFLFGLVNKLHAIACPQCHGRGETIPPCSKCEDGGEDHECPASVKCSSCDGDCRDRRVTSVLIETGAER